MSDEEMVAVEASKPTVTRPARSKSAPARRAAAAKKVPPPAQQAVDVEDDEDEEPKPEPIRLVLKPTGETLNYATFQLPRTGDDGKKSVVTGTVYAPKGTRTIKILVI